MGVEEGCFSGSGEMVSLCSIGDGCRGGEFLIFGDVEGDLRQAILVKLGLNIVDCSL